VISEGDVPERRDISQGVVVIKTDRLTLDGEGMAVVRPVTRPATDRPETDC
jgi:hypothetical protein